MYKKVKACRICGNPNLKLFLTLGNIPLPNGFLTKNQLSKPEKYFPLNACLCEKCGLVQLQEIVNPNEMFKNYVYIPSTSKTRMNNFSEIAEYANKNFKLNHNSLVIDIGSNDGSLLSYFKGYGIKTLGIDPAVNLAKIAELKGITTINNYITPVLAKKIYKKYGQANVITATNVVAHIDNLYDLFKSVEILLGVNGVFICEFPYLLDLIKNNQFDTIYHEHLSYFSIKPLIKLTSRVNLELFDVFRSNIDGGSLRVVFKKKNIKLEINAKIKKLLDNENNYGLYNFSTYQKFAKRVKHVSDNLQKTLKKIKKQGKTIAGYGAAAKGNILLNYCHINDKLIDYIVDSTPYKQGLFTPGTHIPIFPEAEIMKTKPDYILILAWNFAFEIMDKEKKYKVQGGKFIIPVPKVTIN